MVILVVELNIQQFINCYSTMIQDLTNLLLGADGISDCALSTVGLKDYNIVSLLLALYNIIINIIIQY